MFLDTFKFFFIVLDKFYFLITSERTKREMLIVTSLASFLVPRNGTSVAVTPPALGEEFGFNSVMLPWITAASIISAAIFILPFGRFSDSIGCKRIFYIGLPIFCLFFISRGVMGPSSTTRSL
jgi:MFS family permease